MAISLIKPKARPHPHRLGKANLIAAGLTRLAKDAPPVARQRYDTQSRQA